MNLPHSVHIPNETITSNNEDSTKGNEDSVNDNPHNSEEVPSSSDMRTDINEKVEEDNQTLKIENVCLSTDWIIEQMHEYPERAYYSSTKPSCNQMINWKWIYESLWDDGLFPDSEDNVSDSRENTMEDSILTFSKENHPVVSLEEENHLLSLTNPSRISPKIFLQLPGALNAICDEINNLLMPDSNKIPGLLVVDYNREEYKHIPRIHSTMIVKRKSTLKFKARLCARGDMLFSDAPLLYSSPTVSRVSPRMILSIAVTYSFSIGIVDITSAFIQSNLVEKSKRLVIIPPYYIPLPWTNKVDPSLPKTRMSSYGLLTIRPLYGTTDAPIRWFVTFSTRFRFCGWTQLESDPCIFRFAKNSTLHGICSLHVDDVLMTGDNIGWESFNRVIEIFRHSGVQKLTPLESLTYLGVDIGYENHQLYVSQESFIETKMPTVDVQAFFLLQEK